MKYIYKTIGIGVIIIFALVSCKKSITESEEKSIIGRWSFSSAHLERTITTNSNQTFKLPFSSIGHIKVKGVTTSQLNGLVIERYEPFTIGVYRIEYEDYLSAVLFIDDDSKVATYYSGITDKTYTGVIDYSYNGNTLTISVSTITNQDDANDTLEVSGEISFESITAETDTPVTIEVPSFQTQYQRGFMEYEFLEDGTFIQTTNENDGWIINTGTWESSGSTLTTTFTENNITEVHVIEFLIDGNILAGTELIDICESNQNPQQCFSSHEQYYQVEDGSITKVMMETTIYMRELNEL